jgi:hypothetical protein
MRELDPRTRLLIDGAKRADGPASCARDRIARTLAGSVATSSVTLGAAAAEAALDKVAGATGLLAWLPGGKLGAVLATGVGLAGGGAVIAAMHAPNSLVGHRTSVTRDSATMNVNTAPRSSSMAGTSTAMCSSAAVTAEPAPAESADLPPASTPRAAVLGTGVSRSKDPSAMSTRPSPSRIADETRLLAQVQAALRAGNGAGALKLLAQYRREFGQGALVEEASAAEVFALCATGDRSRAERATLRFLSGYPNSPLQPRIESSCGMRKGIP